MHKAIPLLTIEELRQKSFWYSSLWYGSELNFNLYWWSKHALQA